MQTPTTTEERPEAQTGSKPERADEPQREPLAQRRRSGLPRWLWRIGLAGAILAATAAAVWRTRQPVLVEVVQPRAQVVTEAIAASGLVGGRRETLVGASMQGVVADLFVREGSRVRNAQPIARVLDDVAQAQVRQAEQALRTARAQLWQAQEVARPSELAAGFARVRQADAMVAERRAALARARSMARQADAAVNQAEAQVERARSGVREAEARAELTAKTLARYRMLLDEEAIPRQTVDQAEADHATARAQVDSALKGIVAAEAGVEAARAAQKAAQDDVTTCESVVRGALAGLSGAEADLRTLQQPPRPEGVEVARQRVRDAEAGLRVAHEQALTAVVRAPFAGTVTEIIAEKGAPAGPAGIVRLVQTGAPEIRMHVDENNLAVLRVGQRAVITSTAFRMARSVGSVTEIGAKVDSARGTVEVTVVPRGAPGWIRPGQTVNVNVVTAEAARRLVVPASALRRDGDRTVALVIRNGAALAKTVIAGPSDGKTATVLEGLAPEDRLVLNAERVPPGARVRIQTRPR